jgi:hypothetical protein
MQAPVTGKLLIETGLPPAFREHDQSMESRDFKEFWIPVFTGMTTEALTTFLP